MKTPLPLIFSALALAGCQTGPFYGPAAAPPALVGATVVVTAEKAPFGTYLVDRAGRSLYVLDGTRGTSGLVACGIDCTRVWPPMMVTAPVTGADPRMLGTVPRGGGAQLSYAGWPLFYYARDMRPGDTAGQNVSDRWGTWYLLSPSGEPIRPAGGY